MRVFLSVDKSLSPKSTPFCFKRGWIV